MTTVLNDSAPRTAPVLTPSPREVRIALLGVGQVGSAVAAAAAGHPDPGCRFTITTALVRDVHRPRGLDTSGFSLTAEPHRVLASNPDVVVEVLGGTEPARTLVLAALTAGIPVVTANKSLLAAYGDELFETADRAGVPLLYEASVLAGVPFLDTFRRRPLARAVTAVDGIVNGTSNFILSRMAHDRITFQEALADAQRAGYAEPDPSKDLDGGDAAEKLCVLLRHFGRCSVAPSRIEQRGIRDITPEDLQHAAAFDGAIRPVALASWHEEDATAYAGPAFIGQKHRLWGVDGVQNAVSLTTRRGDTLFFSGPGAGPEVTASTVLDDVAEATRADGYVSIPPARACAVGPRSDAGWFVRLTSAALAEQQVPELLLSLGVRLARVSHVDARGGRHHQWLLTQPCGRGHLSAVLGLLESRSGVESWLIPCVD